MFVLFEKKNRYTFRHNIHDNIQEMIPKQATYHSQEGDDTENSQENAKNQRSRLRPQTEACKTVMMSSSNLWTLKMN